MSDMEIQAPNSARSGSIHMLCVATETAHSRSVLRKGIKKGGLE